MPYPVALGYRQPDLTATVPLSQTKNKEIYDAHVDRLPIIAFFSHAFL